MTGSQSSAVTAKDVTGNSKIVKTRETLSLVATAIPVIGLLCTAGLWAANNYYVGDVNISTDRSFHNLTIKAFDKKGQESTFHTPHFQLMPGAYHLEITADGQLPEHSDTIVSYQKQSTVSVSLKQNQASENTESKVDSEDNPGKKRHWWQIWHR